jgi:hypothetical protein
VLLTFFGYYKVHRAQKVQEWLNLKFSTWYGLQSFNYTKGTYEKLEEIAQLLKDLKK